MAHNAKEFLAFLQYIEIYERYFEVLCIVIVLHTVIMTLANHAQLVLQLVGFVEHSVVCGELSRGEHGLRPLHQFANPAAQRCQLVDIRLRKRVEVVGNVLFGRFQHTL